MIDTCLLFYRLDYSYINDGRMFIVWTKLVKINTDQTINSHFPKMAVKSKKMFSKCMLTYINSG